MGSQVLRGPRDARDRRDVRLEVRVGLHDRLVLRHGRDGRDVGVEDRVELLDSGARHVADELDRGILVLRVLGHRELPAANGADRLAVSAVRKHRDVELALDL